MKNPIKHYALVLGLGALLLSGCATPGKPYDYTAFRESKPTSILVLPPLNNSPDVKATYSMYAQVTVPLAEAGYYVFPVTLVNETFKQNGMTVPADIHALPAAKLRKIFGADTALYIVVTQYGSTYNVISSEARVSADGRLVDLRNGQTLWQGTATASSAEQQNNNNNGLLGALITAMVSQVLDTMSNRSHPIAGITSQRLLAAGHPNGILYGPRSPLYMKDGTPSP